MLLRIPVYTARKLNNSLRFPLNYSSLSSQSYLHKNSRGCRQRVHANPMPSKIQITATRGWSKTQPRELPEASDPSVYFHLGKRAAEEY